MPVLLRLFTSLLQKFVANPAAKCPKFRIYTEVSISVEKYPPNSVMLIHVVVMTATTINH